MPEQLVSDNGPQFTSAEFTQFLEGNRIKHILSAPYHPASNGLAKCFVQALKRILKASSNDGKSIHHRLTEFLFEYRATPHATTNVAPCELFFKRKLRTRFDLMMPNTKQQVTSKHADQKQHHDKRSKLQPMFPGTTIFVREYNGPHKWIPGVILQKLGPVTFSVAINNGRTVKRHIDQLCHRIVTPKAIATPATTSSDTIDIDTYPYSPPEDTTVSETTTEQHTTNPATTEPPERHYSLRQRRPPDCLTLNFDGQSHS